MVDCFTYLVVNWWRGLYYSTGVIMCCWHNSKLICWYGAFITCPLLFVIILISPFPIIVRIEPHAAPLKTTTSSIFSPPGAGQTRAASPAWYPSPWPPSPCGCIEQGWQQAPNSRPLYEKSIKITQETPDAELFSISTQEAASWLQATPSVER